MNVLFLNEPSPNPDPFPSKILIKKADEIHGGEVTCIWSTHQMPKQMRCVIWGCDSKMVFDGSYQKEPEKMVKESTSQSRPVRMAVR